MVVFTNTPYIEHLRRDIIDLILSDHPYDCMVCQKTGECELQELAYKYGIRKPIFSGERRIYSSTDQNPFIERDMEKCILCGRCVKVCDEVQGVGAIDFAYKGFGTKVCPPFEKDLNCEFCGQCVMLCPTGALVGRSWIGKGRYWKINKVDTTCPYCGIGCNITLHVKDNKIVRVTSREDSVVNKGLLCVKGRFAYEFVSSPERLQTPLIRRDGALQPASWEEALSYAAKKLIEIKETRGPDSIAGPVLRPMHHGRQLPLPEIHQGRHRHEQCRSLCPSLTRTYGGQSGHDIRFRAMTNSIREIEDNEVIFIIGSNTKESHPVIANMMLKAQRKGREDNRCRSEKDRDVQVLLSLDAAKTRDRQGPPQLYGTRNFKGRPS